MINIQDFAWKFMKLCILYGFQNVNKIAID